MGTDRGGAVRVGALQAKLEPRFDVRFAVVLATVGDDGVLGAGVGAVRVRLTRPGLRLVEVHVAVDEAGPDLTVVEVDPGRRGPGRRDCGDAAVRDP